MLMLIRWLSWMHGIELIVEQERLFGVAFFQNLFRATRYIWLIKFKFPFYKSMTWFISIFASGVFKENINVIGVYSWLFAFYLQGKILFWSITIFFFFFLKCANRIDLGWAVCLCCNNPAHSSCCNSSLD